MDEEIKRGLKRIAKNAEIKVTESILRWKYKKEGKKVPGDQDIGQQSEELAHEAHEIIAKRGKNIWKELKKAYRKRQKGGRDRD